MEKGRKGQRKVGGKRASKGSMNGDLFIWKLMEGLLTVNKG